MDWKTWLERREKIRLSSADWEFIQEEAGRSSDIQDSEVEGYRLRLTSEARRLKTARRHAKNLRPRKKVTERDRSVVELTPSDLARAKAFTLYVGELARSNRDLQHFRKEVLGGHIASRDEAIRFLKSHVLSYQPALYFRMHSIPVFGHECHLEPTSEMFENDSTPQTRRLTISWDGHERVEDVNRRLFSPDDQSPIEKLKVEIPKGGSHDITVWKRSVHDRLRELSEKLSRATPWRPGRAAWFVLTDQVPDIHPLWVTERSQVASDVGGSFVYKRLTIQVEPWVSANTVLEVYRAAQQASLPGRNRKLLPKNLELLSFAMERRIGESPSPWRTIMSDWNAEHPDAIYEDSRRFQRDYKRALRAVTLPEYERL